MPLQGGHVFASHIGHTGKTTLCFQMSCMYAKAFPEVSVLVMDLAEEGDLTKRLLGGVDGYEKAGADICGGIFKLLGDADRKTSGVTSWLWSSDVDITAHAVQVATHNEHIPSNLFLLSSGAWPRSETPFASEKRKQLCAKILDSMQKSDKIWKLFCDTDGDRRPSPFTMIGYSLCSQAIVPLHLNKGDLDRTETMLGILNDLRQNGEINTQVLLVVWNLVKSLKEKPEKEAEERGLSFTPTKVSLDILDACNKRLFANAQAPDMPGLFAHGGEGVSEQDFVAASTFVMRQLADNVQKPAEELGMPFVRMVEALEAKGTKSMPFKTGDVVYKADAEQIHNVDEAMKALGKKFEMMSVGAGSS